MQLRSPNLRKSILCVEDDPDTVEVYKAFLSGYQVSSAYTMAEALLLAEARSYDLYLLDNLLPDGTGIELCQRIREFDATTPIIFATGSASDEEKQQAMSVGAQAYLFKPIDLDLLERAITHLDTEPREESKFFMD